MAGGTYFQPHIPVQAPIAQVVNHKTERRNRRILARIQTDRKKIVSLKNRPAQINRKCRIAAMMRSDQRPVEIDFRLMSRPFHMKDVAHAFFPADSKAADIAKYTFIH